MIDFKAIKGLVTAREAAEHYGLNVNSRGMALCPFHDDHNPSMKLDERFHCFGCGEDGDVIDFTAKYFNLSLKEAADKLLADFGNGVELPYMPAPPKPPDPAHGRAHHNGICTELPDVRFYRRSGRFAFRGHSTAERGRDRLSDRRRRAGSL